MKKTTLFTVSFLILLFVFSFESLLAQSVKKHIREGNREYNHENFPQSELEYRKALEAKNKSLEGRFNLGAALYKQDKFTEAAKTFSEIPEDIDNPAVISRFYHNKGNSLLKSQNIKESIEAYKKALRHNPSDMETKYNLAYAQKLLNQQKNQEQDQENKQDQNKENQEQQQQDKNQEQNKEQQENKTDKISREDAERLLQAVENEEKNVQEKLKQEKASQQQIRVIRNW